MENDITIGIDDMIAVMQAYKEGKPIQTAVKGRPELVWMDIEQEPFWDFFACYYRVKPEEPKPKLRPYANAEEFLQAQKEHGPYLRFRVIGTLAKGETYVYEHPIWIGGDKCIVYDFGSDYFTHHCYLSLVEHKWQDGTPCGIIEE